MGAREQGLVGVAPEGMESAQIHLLYMATIIQNYKINRWRREALCCNHCRGNRARFPLGFV